MNWQQYKTEYSEHEARISHYIPQQLAVRVSKSYLKIMENKFILPKLYLWVWSLLLVFGVIFFLMISPVSAQTIEWLEFNVPRQEQAEFIKQDRLIWDNFLSQYPAFLGKEIWQGIDQPDRLVIVAKWNSYEEWKAIPPDKIKQTTDRFHQVLGKEYPIVNSYAFSSRFTSKDFLPPHGRIK